MTAPIRFSQPIRTALSSVASGRHAPGPRSQSKRQSWRSWGVITAALVTVLGCTTTGGPPDSSTYVSADEPQAVQAGSAMVAAGGNAVDAAVASALAMAVTLPSRVGLAGGGVCLVHHPQSHAVRTLDFLPRPASGSGGGGGGNSGAAMPGMLRGLYTLHGAYGKLRWEQVVGTAEALARMGSVSRAFAQDLHSASARLGRDETARKLFLPGGAPLAEGRPLVQNDLAEFLMQVRRSGANTVYSGATAGTLASGLGVSAEALRAYRPAWRETLIQAVEYDEIHIANAEGLNSNTTLGAWKGMEAAQSRDWARALVEGLESDPNTRQPAAPGASVAAIDGSGQGVACVLTMGGAFGSGRMIPGTGVFAAAAQGNAGLGGPLLRINAHKGHTVFAAAAAVATGDGSDETAAVAPAALLMTTFHSQLRQRPATEAIAAGRAAPGAIAAGRAAPGRESRTPLVEASVPAEALGNLAGIARAHPGLGRVAAVACPVDRATGYKHCVALADPRGAGLGARTQ